MKIQCSCGAKYSFDVTPEMRQNPVRFVCPGCGLDSSDFVNGLIRREFEQPATAATPQPQAAPDAIQTPASGPARIHIHKATRSEPSAEPAAPDAPVVCKKHPDELTTHRCLVCQKPICPKCMELFGYVCSPLCKAKADSHGIEIPVYAGQRSVIEARRWRRTGLVAGGLGAVAAAVLGFWFWYAWFGSVPKPIFSVHFDEPAYSGVSKLCGTNQIVSLHGGTLSRHDIKAKKEIWSRQLVDDKIVADAVARQIKFIQAAINRANGEGGENAPKMPPPMQLAKSIKRGMAAALELRVSGQNIWVIAPGKLVRYDWETGKPAQEVPIAGGFGRASFRGDELLLAEGNGLGQEVVTRFNLTTGKSSVETIGEPANPVVAKTNPKGPGKGTLAADPGATQMAGMPVGKPGADAGKPLDPAKIAAQAQQLSLPAKIALPAVLASSANQERTMAELNDEQTPQSHPRPQTTRTRDYADGFSFVPSQYGYVEFSTRLLESRIVERTAMKAPPKKSALNDPNLTVTRTADVANEMLNDMQRSRGGDTVTEDESRYQVTVRLPDAKGAQDWTGEVNGPPALFPLKTVNVVTGGKTLIVLDKTNKKLWQGSLAYSVVRGLGAPEDEDSQVGQGPCVERGNFLYVFDQAVLTAFDLVTGNVRWRLPTVGVAGLFFDDKGMMYVNTTTASPESIKYSRQIDITQKTGDVILKIDPRTGKTLWSANPGGVISRVSGKFIYVVESNDPGEDEFGNPHEVIAGLEMPAYLRIKRLNAGNGHVMWEYYQPRAPLDVQFNGNSIHIVFKKEVQVLKFFSL